VLLLVVVIGCNKLDFEDEEENESEDE